MAPPAVQAPRGMRTPPGVRAAAQNGESMAAAAIADVGVVSPTHLHQQEQHAPSSLASLPPLPLGEMELDISYGDIVSGAFDVNGRGEFFPRFLFAGCASSCLFPSPSRLFRASASRTLDFLFFFFSLSLFSHFRFSSSRARNIHFLRFFSLLS